MWSRGRTRYHVTVTNPDHGNCGVATAELDGAPVDPRAIPIVEDHEEHRVGIVMSTPGLAEPGARIDAEATPAVG